MRKWLWPTADSECTLTPGSAAICPPPKAFYLALHTGSGGAGSGAGPGRLALSLKEVGHHDQARSTGCHHAQGQTDTPLVAARGSVRRDWRRIRLSSPRPRPLITRVTTPACASCRP